jgi:hypothetical protein
VPSSAKEEAHAGKLAGSGNPTASSIRAITKITQTMTLKTAKLMSTLTLDVHNEHAKGILEFLDVIQAPHGPRS